MGTDYYSYLIAGIDATKCIIRKECEEKNPYLEEVDGKKISIFDEEGKQLYRIKKWMCWKFMNDMCFDFEKLREAIKSHGLTLFTQGCEDEIWEGDAIGLKISECEVDDSAIPLLDDIIDKLKEVGNILSKMKIEETPILIHLMQVSY